jgi:hypothetical protein
MANTPPTPSFENSYGESERYPRNLIYQTTYPTAISAYIARLDSDGPQLFVKDVSEIEISFRDFRSNSTLQRIS